MVTTPTPEPLNEATVVDILLHDLGSIWYSNSELEAFVGLIRGEYKSGDSPLDLAVKLERKKRHIDSYYGGSPIRAKNYKEWKGYW